MGRISWFSEEGDALFFQRYVDRMGSWQQAIADGRIDPEEVRAQENHKGQHVLQFKHQHKLPIPRLVEVGQERRKGRPGLHL